ncbi:trans-aconitate 2-methyltransferase [Chitinophaga skermanii]|uniref:Trans-aconitate 2-methyltransferase n=1 Tax=Chitinophaga skermanii TaxID=331697 RepID=A0A327QZE5_9BACT|nr:methyltransferase domain-containing protein [Chitinophaga skermanii]RAJ08803.1 trans-aconitate 2-methyltransferase [Chitinophaga skermanii]
MPWNPEVYNQFKDVRFKPFFDLASLIQAEENMQAIDIGCGTGEQTAILTEQLPNAYFTGVDSSPEMLQKSATLENDRLHFELGTTEDLIASGKRWDLIFSNAALQWSDDHTTLFPNLLHLLNKGAQFAVQMPVQNENILNKLLLELVNEEPFRGYLNGWQRISPVLSMDAYAQMMFEHGLEQMQIMTKVYPIIANDHDTLYNFISGSALVPYMERLNTAQQEEFTKVYKARIAAYFTKLPAIYAFKRVLLYGRKA